MSINYPDEVLRLLVERFGEGSEDTTIYKIWYPTPETILFFCKDYAHPLISLERNPSDERVRRTVLLQRSSAFEDPAALLREIELQLILVAT